MYSANRMPWEKINDFLLDVGSIRDPKELCISVLNNISSLVPIENAVLYYFDKDLDDYESVLLDVDPYWSLQYMNYYSKIENGRYSFTNVSEGEISWSDFPQSEYVRDFMKPQGNDHSASIKFTDLDYGLDGAIALNRSGRKGFGRVEKNILRVLRSHLTNLYTNLTFRMKDITIKMPGILSGREAEIAELLCKGMKPSSIGDKLFISPRTVHKHLENIHRKVGVSSRQELLTKLLKN